MEQGGSDLQLAIQGVAVDQKAQGILSVALTTTRGQIDALYHPAEGEGGALICVGGAGGGVTGPAKGLYERLGHALNAQGVSTLRRTRFSDRASSSARSARSWSSSMTFTRAPRKAPPRRRRRDRGSRPGR